MINRLKSFAGVGGLEVLRDGPFEVTGKLSTPLDGLLVPVKGAAFIAEANANPRVTAVITLAALAEQVDERLAVAIADDPLMAHAEVHALCAKARAAELESQPTVIDSTAQIDPSARIAPYGVTIGARTHVGAMVSIQPGVSVANECVLHPGVALGVAGFQVGRINGRQRIIPQLGGVRLEPFVELLANTCVARALFGGATTIGEETVSDNLVYIAHDCQIGRRVQICALANILGRVVIGDDAYIGPSSTIVNGAIIGAKAKVTMGAVVTREVGAGQTVTGNFAIPHEQFLDNLRKSRFGLGT